MNQLSVFEEWKKGRLEWNALPLLPGCVERIVAWFCLDPLDAAHPSHQSGGGAVPNSFDLINSKTTIELFNCITSARTSRANVQKWFFHFWISILSYIFDDERTLRPFLLYQLTSYANSVIHAIAGSAVWPDNITDKSIIRFTVFIQTVVNWNTNNEYASRSLYTVGK